MKKPIVLLLLCCFVMTMTAPVSADYYWYKDVNADDFTNALVDYCNQNTVYNMSEYECKLSGHNFRIYNATRLDFDFECRDSYVVFGFLLPFIPIPSLPISETYSFIGHMHGDYRRDCMVKPYTLTITDEDTKFTAVGSNWRLDVWNTSNTRFKA